MTFLQQWVDLRVTFLWGFIVKKNFIALISISFSSSKPFSGEEDPVSVPYGSQLSSPQWTAQKPGWGLKIVRSIPWSSPSPL